MEILNTPGVPSNISHIELGEDIPLYGPSKSLLDITHIGFNVMGLNHKSQIIYIVMVF